MEQEKRWPYRPSPGRIESLCDGVFAIAMTLLVLELSVPHFPGTPWVGEGPTSLLEMGMEFYTYALGFLALGVFWVLHHYIFHFIRRSDGVLVWLNILFFAIVALVPFWTEVLNVNEGYLSRAYYGVSMVIAILILFLMWQYATRGHRLVDRNIDERAISFLNRIILTGSSMLAAVIALSYIDTRFAYLYYVVAAFFIIATSRDPQK